MSPTPSSYALWPYAGAAAIAPYGFRRAELTRPRPAASTVAHRLRARPVVYGYRTLQPSAGTERGGVCMWRVPVVCRTPFALIGDSRSHG
jgi:hypothetical protein